MCGQFRTVCGRCGRDAGTAALTLADVPGYCPQCGFLNRPSAKRCQSCGAVLGTPQGEAAYSVNSTMA